MSEIFSEIEIPDFSIIEPIEDRIDAMCEFCNINRTAVPEKCLELATEAKTLSTEINYRKGMGLSLMQSGFQHWHLSDMDQAFDDIEKGIKIIKEENVLSEIGNASMVKAMIIWAKGEYEIAFSTIYEAIELLNSKKEKVGFDWLHWTLGVFNYDLKDYAKSLDNYQKAHKFYKSGSNKNDQGFLSYILIGLGSVHKALEDYDKAKNYLNRALKTSQSAHHWMEEARCYFEIGEILLHNGDLKSAEEHLSRSYEMRKAHNTKNSMASSLLVLAKLKSTKKNYKEALDYLQEALQLSLDTGSKPKTYQCYQELSELYKTLGEYEKAFDHLKLFYELKSDVIGEEANNLIKDLQTKFATEKAEKEKEIHILKNIELKNAHEEILLKNKEITDSIEYAKRIQKAILPPLNAVSDNFPQSFVIYVPKDIVSGDFYWTESFNNYSFIAAADCTGHGVPGALVSVICNNALNRTVREFGLQDPGEILNKTREIVIKEFEKSEEDVKDGMDIALCVLNQKVEIEGASILYAGALNPLWIVRSESEDIEVVKPNKQPIGKFDQATPFASHEVELKKGDTFYIFSDGFADQFGGEKGKKFKAPNFKKLLISINHEPMKTQKNKILEAFNSWKGNHEQVDDVCIIGVRI